MGKRKYPPLKQSEMVAIFLGLGFRFVRVGKHPCYERDADAVRKRKIVPVDDYDEFEENLIKSLISQSGFTREEFYGATKASAKKINIQELFTPCGKCGKGLGQTLSCELCLRFLKVVSSN
jgi:predicted RNA binding protein YcfA (HicA-like mRNA interferase family)